jgi:hypothetical protein
VAAATEPSPLHPIASMINAAQKSEDAKAAHPPPTRSLQGADSGGTRPRVACSNA